MWRMTWQAKYVGPYRIRHHVRHAVHQGLMSSARHVIGCWFIQERGFKVRVETWQALPIIVPDGQCSPRHMMPC